MRLLHVFEGFFPIVKKELIEQAAQKKTYVMRFIYGVLFYGIFIGLWVSSKEGSIFSQLGSGKHLVECILYLQFAGIFLLLPAMTAGVISSEKERNTLPLLFITKISLGDIVLEKLLGRLIPMITFILMGILPIALGYSFGGVSAEFIGCGVYVTFLSLFQVAAISMMFSCLCRTTIQSILLTYLFGFLFYMFLPFCEWVFTGSFGDNSVSFFFPPHLLFSNKGETLASLYVYSVPIIFSIFIFLGLARYFLVRRAFVPPQYFMINLFKRIDRVLERINKVLGNIKFFEEKSTLPKLDPILWRETHKRSLGNIRYLIRVILILTLPVLIICFFLIITNPQDAYREYLSIFYIILFILVAIIITVKSSSIIETERTTQTLDLLLTTPITAKEIVKQKMAGLNRLTYVLYIPLTVIILIRTCMVGFFRTSVYYYGGSQYVFRYTSSGDKNENILYLVGSLITLVLYFPMLRWVMLWIGLKLKKGRKNVLYALAFFILWWFLVYAVGLFVLSDQDGDLSLLSSPLTMLITLGQNRYPLDLSSNWGSREKPLNLDGILIINTLLYIGVFLVFRLVCLANCENYLRGRAKPLWDKS